jgi:hypothetical protein
MGTCRVNLFYCQNAAATGILVDRKLANFDGGVTRTPAVSESAIGEKKLWCGSWGESRSEQGVCVLFRVSRFALCLLAGRTVVSQSAIDQKSRRRKSAPAKVRFTTRVCPFMRNVPVARLEPPPQTYSLWPSSGTIRWAIPGARELAAEG